jgi:hypothetical protein
MPSGGPGELTCTSPNVQKLKVTEEILEEQTLRKTSFVFRGFALHLPDSGELYRIDELSAPCLYK